VIKAHMPIFTNLYKKGCTKMKPGDKPFMTVEDFETIFLDGGLMSDSFASRDILIAFNTAMMTQVNEIEKDKHLKALLVEFLEAFGRACEKLSFPEHVRYRLF
jgi:hypothetical protein